jgi:hypothetical protein
MLRTWLVRLLAIELTLSVRSFQVPATPLTFACPPSLPSVPTSRATRVTSAANEPSCSTIVFTVRAVRRNSPARGRLSTSSAIVCDRSPFATAPITRAVSVVGRTRSLISAFTDWSEVAHAPRASPIAARWLMRPSLPTLRLTRSSSSDSRSFSATTSLNASAIFPAIPVQSSGNRTVKSPRFSELSALSSCLLSSCSLIART